MFCGFVLILTVECFTVLVRGVGSGWLGVLVGFVAILFVGFVWGLFLACGFCDLFGLRVTHFVVFVVSYCWCFADGF